MNLEVTQDNIHLFLPGLISNASYIMAERTNKSMLDCIRQLYALPIYKQLEIASTNAWHISPYDLANQITQL